MSHRTASTVKVAVLVAGAAQEMLCSGRPTGQQRDPSRQQQSHDPSHSQTAPFTTPGAGLGVSGWTDKSVVVEIEQYSVHREGLEPSRGRRGTAMNCCRGSGGDSGSTECINIAR